MCVLVGIGKLKTPNHVYKKVWKDSSLNQSRFEKDGGMSTLYHEQQLNMIISEVARIIYGT